MGFSNFAAQAAKHIVNQAIPAFQPGQQTTGHGGPTHEERALAQELDQNYAHAQREFQNVGVQRDRHQRIAVCIGCNYPNDEPHSLAGCVNDAHHWAELLSRNYDFNVQLMTDDPLKRGQWNDPTVPTLQNVVSVLKNCAQSMQRGDCLAITFSGHGTRKRDRQGEEADGYDECLVLPDHRSGICTITDDDLYREVISLVPEGCKVTAIFDCCKSGGALDLNWEMHTSRDSAGNARLGNWKQVTYNTFQAPADVTLISGCASEQSSLEVAGIAGRGGALTTEMIKKLSRDPYGHTYQALLEYTVHAVYNNAAVNRHSNPQLPTLSSSIPFDVSTRMFGPDQLTGIQIPDAQATLNSNGTHSQHGNQQEIDVPGFLLGLMKRR